MIYNYLLWGYFGFLAYFTVGTVGREVIVGGDVAQPLQFPYQTSVLMGGDDLSCGGGIVNSNSVVTAASCVIGPNDNFINNTLFVIAGTSNLQRQCEHTVTIQVTAIYVPREYNHGYASTTGDIAVLKLKSNFNMTSSNILAALQLPSNRHETYAGRQALIAGFGWHWVHASKYVSTGGRNDTRLRYADAEILSHRECQENHPEMRISDRHLCARVIQREHSQPRGVCVGDGGGPLVHNGVLIGIFSLGPTGCTEQTHSAIYTRVSHFLKLIRHAKAGTVSFFVRKIDLI